MKICIVAGSFPKLSETFVINQALGLRARGHDVHILCREPGGQAPDGLRVRAWWGPAAALKSVVAKLPWRWQDRASAGLDRLSAPQLRSFDAVIAHFGHNGSRVARALKRLASAPPLITIFHGRDVGTVDQGDATAMRYRDLFTNGALNLPVNGWFRDILIRNGADAARTRVHHMGIELDAIPFAERAWAQRPLSILTVARLTEKKGVAYALQALAAFRTLQPAVEFTYRIVGEGELQVELEQLSHDLGLATCVEFLGPRPHAEVRRLLTGAQIFLLPSVTAADGDVEGIPVSLMEAMASGAVAVSTRHSGIPELIEDGVSGFLAAERDVEALADRLAFVADHPGQMTAIARAARAHVEREFNADLQIALLEREILSVAKPG